MALLPFKNSYQIPRGKVLFDPLDGTDQPTGARRFGNCPSTSINIDAKKNPHYSAEGGLREKDFDMLSEITRTLDLECDNMSVDNLSLWLTGTAGTQQQSSGNVTGELIDVLPGRIYQLGATPATPTGNRKISTLVITSDDGVTTYAPTDDYVLDADSGLLQITEAGAISQKTKIKASYAKGATSWTQVRSGNIGDVRGRLRIISDNASGPNQDWYFPLVTLTPSGGLPLVQDGQDYTKMKFSVEVLKPSDMEAVYVDGHPSTIP